MQIGPFEEQRFEFEYVDHVSVEDLNADGRPDLVVQNGIELLIFLQRNGGLPRKPDRILRFEEDVFLWTFGRFGGAPAIDDLLTMSPRGIRRHGKPGEDLIIAPTLFEGKPSVQHPPVRLDFAPDVDGDGTSELLHFSEEGLGLYGRVGGRYRLRRRFPMRFETFTESTFAAGRAIRSRVTFPYVAWRDVDGNGRLDLVEYDGRSVRFYLQDGAGGFAGNPVVAEKIRVKRKRRGRYLQFEILPLFVDATGDGVMDILTADPGKGRVWIHYGRNGRVEFAGPDAERSLEDFWLLGMMVEPLSAGGRPVLILWVLPRLGLFRGISAFASKKVESRLYFFPVGGDGRIEKQAAGSVKFDLPFLINATRDRMEFSLTFQPNLKGDYDGDGNRDLVLLEGNTLRIYRGLPNGTGVQQEPAFERETARPSENAQTRILTADLNGDGRSDLVLRHLDPSAKTVVEIWTSRR